MSSNASIQSKHLDGDVLVLKLHGSLDTTSTEDFNQEVQKHLDEGRHKIIIDCAHLEYVSSLGMGALVVLQSRLRKQGGQVKLAAINGAVAKVLSAVHLDKVLDIYGDTEFARQSFT